MKLTFKLNLFSLLAGAARSATGRSATGRSAARSKQAARATADDLAAEQAAARWRRNRHGQDYSAYSRPAMDVDGWNRLIFDVESHSRPRYAASGRN